MSKRDYYEILQITTSASDDEIKRSYRKLAIKYHPDQNKDNPEAEGKFKEVNEAYQILSDPQKKAAYDQYGHAGLGQGGGGFGFEQGFGGGGFGDIFDNIFGDIFGGGGGTRRASSRGVDLRYNLSISFEEAAFGVEKEISFAKQSSCATCEGSGAKPGTKPIVCGTCEGTGQVRMNQGFFTLTRTCSQCSGSGYLIKDHCKDCSGDGVIQKNHKLNVKVPAGIESDQRLRLKGEGEYGQASEPGDLYVVIHVKEHPIFERQSEHVFLALPVSFTQAALGQEIDVPTLNGSAKLKLKAGTQTGENYKMRGKGIKRLNGSGHGDQIVQIRVETPTKLTAKQKELLLEFEEQGSIETQPGVSSFFNKVKDMFKG